MAKFYIDAGHGGKDSGAVGVGGVHEADINLTVAKHLEAELKRNGQTVKMCRTTDIFKDLPERTAEANAWGADYYISIHCNAYDDASANGTETFCYKKGGEGEKIAAAIQKELLAVLKTRDRGVKEANFYVLRKSNMPASLTELAFVTNKSDCAKLTDAATKKQCAVAICKGICKYLNITYKGEQPVEDKRDNTPDKYAEEDIKWAIDNDLLKGDGNGDLMLHSNLTRQDLFVVLHRYDQMRGTEK